ncbi:hypothetical protein L208DRAFT_1535168, partial [Tricholoma matsutake]
MVKNTFWVVAKQKLLDNSLGFYITQTGEDCLQVNFGIYRLMDNSQNIDMLQLSQHASTAIEILCIFGAYPEWDRGHRCLRLDGVEGVDHTNPKSWTGDVQPSGVSLLMAWNAGRRKATQIFQELHVAYEDFSTLDKTIDLMCPFGEYVSLRESNID